MTIPTISALPTAPSRNDPATFADRADAMVSALPTLVTQINAATAAIPAEIDALALDAAADATAPYTSAAAASAVSAAAARDLSIAAWAASMAPAETLPAISQSLHIGAIVAAKIYDTSKDSDGGAWRKRCQHTSWYTETLGGSRWIGQQASIAAAWTAAGSTTGAVFQASATAGPLTIGKYYAATSGTTATEVFRGVKAEFPAVAAVVAETGRVVIYDMTVPVPAMWMVANRVSGGRINGNTNNYINCIAFSAGILWVGTGNPDVGFLSKLDFAKDFGCSYADNGNAYNGGSIATRNTTGSHQVTGTGPALTNRNVNAIATTVLPGAPVDPATGLPVPTIAVATDGDGAYSTSVIKNDGTVVNIASDSAGTAVSINFEGNALKIVRSDGTVYVWNGANALSTGLAASATLSASSTPALLGTAAKSAPNAIGSSSGVTLVKRNEATLASSMAAYITAAYPGMWQVGDSKRAWLCDATAETVTGGTQPDRSVKNKPITVNGSLTKTMVGGVATYSGFSASNYLEEAYSADLDFGTGDFCVMGWALISAASSSPFFSRGVSDRNFTILTTDSDTRVYLGNVAIIIHAVAPSVGVNFYAVYRSGTTVRLSINGTVVASATSAIDITLASAKVRIGLDHTGLSCVYALALWRISATSPSADQIAQIYRDELALFQNGAVGTLAGSSSAVTALDYDDSTDLLHVGTSTHRSAFRGLTRVSSEATPAGAIASLSASGGAVLTGGTSGYLYQPALLLRDELRRKEEAKRALGKEVVFFDYDAVTSQVAFALPKGYTTKAVYSAGTLKRLGSTKDYTTSTDGYVETVTFGAAPGNTVWVSIMAVRSN